MDNPNRMALLRNGSKAPMSTVITIMVSLESLRDGGPTGLMALYELNKRCGNDEYTVDSSAKQELVDLGLMGEDDRIHEITRNIVLSSVEVEGFLMRLNPPVTEG